jgi:uncharacterized protein YciI
LDHGRPPLIGRPVRHFTLVCVDGAGSAERRAEILDAHKSYMESVWRQVAVAGPLHDAHDGRVIGSLYVVVADDEVDARRLVESDPFFVAGIWQDVSVKAFTPALGSWLGGRIWS